MRLLTSPMSWGDISKAMGVGGPPYTMGNMVVNAPNINKWSKVKPTTVQAADNVVAFANAAARNTAFGLVNFGLTPTVLTYTNMRANYKTSNWAYTAPQAPWWRTGPNQDLDGYIAHADAWQLGQSTSTMLFGPFGLTLQVPSTTVGDGDVIVMSLFKDNINFLVELADFANWTYDLQNWYIGLLIVENVANPTEYALYNTGAKPSADDYQYFEIPVPTGSAYNNKNFDLIPVLIQSPTNTDPGYTGTSGYLCSFDAVYLPNIRKVQASYNVSVTNTITGVTSNSISGTVVVKNTSGVAITVSANNFFMYLEAEHIVDWMPDYHNKIVSAADAFLGSSHTIETGGIMGDGTDATKIIARYLKFTNSNFTVASGSSKSYNWTLNYGADGLGNAYNTAAMTFNQIGYTPSGQTMQYRRF